MAAENKDFTPYGLYDINTNIRRSTVTEPKINLRKSPKSGTKEFLNGGSDCSDDDELLIELNSNKKIKLQRTTDSSNSDPLIAKLSYDDFLIFDEKYDNIGSSIDRITVPFSKTTTSPKHSEVANTSYTHAKSIEIDAVQDDYDPEQIDGTISNDDDLLATRILIFKNKYLKYKNKYLKLKKSMGN